MASARPSDELTNRATPARLLSILVVLGVLVGVAGLLVPRFVDGGGDDSSERKAVVSRATDFAVTYNTYAVDEKADYQKRMKSLLTPTYFKEFTTVTNAVFDAIKAKNQSSGDAKVLDVAIDSIDKDSAVVLVAVNAKITTNQDKTAAERRFRWKVTFTHAKGAWLISQFDTVATLEATTGKPSSSQPSSTPSPAPSPSASEGGKQ